MNINKFKNLLVTANVDFRKDQFALSLRGSVSGTSVSMMDLKSSSPTDFQYLVQAGASATYKLKSTDTNFALYYKFTGPDRIYVSDGASDFRLGKVDSFHMMDFIVSQPFWNKHFEISAGVKNIFDVTRLNSTAVAGSAHTAANGFVNLFYGRSYFARLMFQF